MPEHNYSSIERYKTLKYTLKTFYSSLKKNGKSVRMGFITFADSDQDIYIFQPDKDINIFINELNNLNNVIDSDFKENPYDAILKLEEINFNPDAQKIVILFTDAPPHVKGDRNRNGIKDFSFKTTEYIKDYIDNSNYCFLVASYTRYDEYQKLLKNSDNQFYDIEFIEDLGNILESLENKIKNEIKIIFTSKIKNANYLDLKKNIKIIVGEEALQQKQIEKMEKIANTSFFKSLFEIF